MIRPVAAIGGATLASRLLGFLRDIAVAGLFGAGARADAFFVALQIANLARRLLAEGALNAAFVPLYLRIRAADGEAEAGALAGRLAGTLTVALVALAAFLALAMPLVILLLAPGFAADAARGGRAAEWARLMLPYLVFAGPAALVMGLLNAERRFAAAAWIAALFNLVLLLALVFVIVAGFGDSDLSGRILAGSVALAGLGQLALMIVALRRLSYRIPRPSISFDRQFRDFIRLAIPGLIAGAIPQLMLMAGIIAASASPGAISWLYYAQRLIELPLGLVGVAIGTVLVPTLSHAHVTDQREDVAAAQSQGLVLALGLSLPAAIALVVLAEPIVRVLFERGAFTPQDTVATATALAALALGLPGHVLFKTWSSSFFARGDTRTPMLASLFSLGIALVGSLALMPAIGHAGAALAIAVAGWAGAGLLAWLMWRGGGAALVPGTRRRLALIALAALVMGVAVWLAAAALQPWLTPQAQTLPRLAALAVLIAGGLCVYGLALAALRVARWRDVRAALARTG
jgi:putative peptidoglycan lipid II flippase